MSEKTLHRAVCQYLKLAYPKVLFNSDLSGIRLTMGQAVQVKALRSSSGFPDIVIYEPRMEFHGLFIELKKEGEKIYTKKGTPTTPHVAEQLQIIKMLTERRYYACFCIGFDNAKRIIDDYLKG